MIASFKFIGAVSIALVIASTSLPAQELPKIFNGNDLSGWKVPTDNVWWKVHDGILEATSDAKKTGSILWTEKKYANFILEFEFKMGAGTVDSGIFVRNDHEQIQIGISGSLKRDMTGSPYIPGKGYPVEAEGVEKTLDVDGWNRMTIVAKGKRYTVWLNDEQVMTYRSDSAAESGPVGIQLHPGREMSIQFRNIRLAELQTAKRNPTLPNAKPLVSAQPITKPPHYHWFGYYDKFQFDPTDRYALSMQVDFQHRSPTKDDVIKIGMIDLQDGNRWIELGESRAWNWQQGCMLQWRPKSNSEVVWNDREGDQLVCRVFDVKSSKMRTLPRPIYHLSPDGTQALGTDFSRLQDQLPGYGYAGVPDANRDAFAPAASTIYLMNLETGESRDIISLADVAKLRFGDQPVPGKLHFNHIQWNPDGKRFIFFSRLNGNRNTRSYTSNLDGTDIRFLGADSSHFEWRDEGYALIWSKGAYRLHADDDSGTGEVILQAGNGHNSYLPNKDWIITDTYPTGKKREQVVYLFHIPTKKKIELGRFHLPKEYAGEWRCDTHPRLNRDGTKIVIDSAHAENGRQMYLIDIEEVLKSPRLK